MKIEKLTKQDKKLIKLAIDIIKNKEEKVSGGVVKEVGSALLTKKGKIFTGVSLDLACGIGFCAEHSAISNMVSHSNETEIDTIVACCDSKTKSIMYPCGRCREMMELVNEKNRKNTWIITPNQEKVKLEDLLPGDWM